MSEDELPLRVEDLEPDPRFSFAVATYDRVTTPQEALECLLACPWLARAPEHHIISIGSKLTTKLPYGEALQRHALRLHKLAQLEDALAILVCPANMQGEPYSQIAGYLARLMIFVETRIERGKRIHNVTYKKNTLEG